MSLLLYSAIADRSFGVRVDFVEKKAMSGKPRDVRTYYYLDTKRTRIKYIYYFSRRIRNQEKPMLTLTLST